MSESSAVEKKPRQQDPIRAAASVVAEWKGKVARAKARVERLTKDLALAEKSVPSCEAGLAEAQKQLAEVLAQ